MKVNPLPPITPPANRVFSEHAERLRTLERQEVDTWTPMLTPLLLPDLRAFWPMSSADESGNVYDLSAQGRTLTANGTPGRFAGPGYIPYTLFDGVDDYYSRADETGLELGGAFTINLWVYIFTAGVEYGLISKWGAAGNRSWRILHTASNAFRFEVSGDGTASVSIDSATIEINSWYNVVAVMSSSNSIALHVNGVKTTNTTSIPASVFDSSAALELGRTNGAGYLDGAIAMPWIANSAYDDNQVKAIYRHTLSIFQVV